MKNKILGVIAIVAVAVIAGYNVYTAQEKVQLSELVMANVEALAEPEIEQPDTNECVSEIKI